MRTKPYNFTAQPPVTEIKVNQSSYENSVVRDLADELRRPAAPEPKPEPKTESEAPKTEQTTENKTENTEIKSESTANLGKEFEEYKEKFRADAEKSIEDPKRAAATTLKFINFIRTFAYPYLIKWAAFEDQEKQILPALMDKVFTAEKNPDKQAVENVHKNFTAFEKRVWDKYEGYQRHIKTVPWTDAEINFLTDVGYLKMQEIKFLRWLMQNEFALAILFIEGRRLGPAVTARMGFGFIELPSMM